MSSHSKTGPEFFIGLELALRRLHILEIGIDHLGDGYRVCGRRI
jgi:hypothetical protein